jgi:hypothetical protein
MRIREVGFHPSFSETGVFVTKFVRRVSLLVKSWIYTPDHKQAVHATVNKDMIVKLQGGRLQLTAKGHHWYAVEWTKVLRPTR